MKRTNYFKLLSLFAVMSAFVLAGCSSKDDEPENPDDNGQEVNTGAMIKSSELPGTWVVESIKDADTGKVTAINQTVHIANFTPTQEHSDVTTSNGFELWAEGFDNILNYDNSVDDDHKGILFGFCKEKGKGLGFSLIYEIIFTTDTYIDKEEDKDRIQIYTLADLHLSGNVLTANQ